MAVLHEHLLTPVREALARSVTVGQAALSADLTDGRTIAVPLAWHPRLLQATPE